MMIDYPLAKLLGKTIGNWKILGIQRDTYIVKARCCTCNKSLKVCRISDIKKRPNSTCRKCYRKRSKATRDKWAWGNKNASTCTAR